MVVLVEAQIRIVVVVDVADAWAVAGASTVGIGAIGYRAMCGGCAGAEVGVVEVVEVCGMRIAMGGVGLVVVVVVAAVVRE